MGYGVLHARGGYSNYALEIKAKFSCPFDIGCIGALLECACNQIQKMHSTGLVCVYFENDQFATFLGPVLKIGSLRYPVIRLHE